MVRMGHLRRFNSPLCPRYSCSNINSDCLFVYCTMHQFFSSSLFSRIAGTLVLCFTVLKQGDIQSWILKLPFQCNTSYADLDGSLCAIQSMFSWSNSCIGKFGSVEHKPLIKWFLKASFAISAALTIMIVDGYVDELLFNGVWCFIFQES